MISLNLSQLILLCMIPGMLSIGLWWVCAVLRERREDRIQRLSTLRCRICGCAYPADAEQEISRCPSCQSANLQEVQRII